MMVVATTMPGGQENSYAAEGKYWLRIGKHVKAPRPNAWSKSLEQFAVEQAPSSPPRKPSMSLWSDADSDGDFGMEEPTDDNWGWGGYTCAGQKMTWPNDNKPSPPAAAAANAYQPYDLTAKDDTVDVTPPADLATIWTPAMQANSDDKARLLRRQAEAESKKRKAEEAAAKEAAHDEAEDEKHKYFMLQIEQLKADSQEYKAESQRS